jgi:hypothetical protein
LRKKLGTYANAYAKRLEEEMLKKVQNGEYMAD